MLELCSIMVNSFAIVEFFETARIEAVNADTLLESTPQGEPL